MTMRIAGITGMFDTDAMVTAQLEPYKLKIQTKTQEKDLLELKQKQYREILKSTRDFYNKYISSSKSDSLMLSSNYKSLKFTSDAPTSVTATANSTASMDNYTINVSQLAAKATTTFSKTDLSAQLDSATGATKGVLYVNSGATATGSDVYVDLVTDVKKNTSGSYYVDTDGKKIIKQSDNTTFKYEDGTIVTSDKIQYEVDMKKTAENLNTKLTEGNLGITAKYSEYSNGIVLESSQMGSSVQFSAMFADFTDVKTNSGDSTAVTKASELTQAQKDYIEAKANNAANGYIEKGKNLHAQITNGANVVYNISEIENVTNSNTKTIDGVTFNFNDETGATEDANGTITGGGTPIKLTGSKDVSAIKDKIVAFINDYNTLIENLNTKLTEKRYKNYMPLTDEQKKDMNEDDIKLWNEKVNSGLIRKDNDVQRIASQMKNAMRTMMSDSGVKLESIGITPVQNYKELNGTFTIDEEKLTAALENNMDGVKELFLRDATDTQNYENDGILTSLKSLFDVEVMSSTKSSLIKKVGLEGSLTDKTSRELDKMQTLIDEMNESLVERENNLYSKYASLESAMNSLSSQQTWLSQQFSS